MGGRKRRKNDNMMNGFRMLDQVVPDTTSLQQRSSYQPSTFVCVSTEGLQENKPELGWSSYDPRPPHATTRRAANSAISSISVQQSPSLVQQNHGDSNSEASTSPINV